jgi:MFS family permease
LTREAGQEALAMAGKDRERGQSERSINMRRTYSPDARVDTSLRASVRDGAAYSVMTGAGETYFTAYALLYQATSAQVSVLAALPALFGSLAQIASAWLAQHLRRRKTLILAGVVLQVLAWLPILWLPYLFPGQAVPILIVSIAFYYVAGHLASPPWSSLMGDLVPERRRGRFFGQRTRLMSLTTFAALTGAGTVLHACDAAGEARLGFTLIFLVATLARAYSFVQLTRMHEPPYVPQPLSLPPFSQLTLRLRQSDFARFTVFVGCLNFTVAIASPFFTVYMLRDLHFSYFEFTAITGTSILSQFATLRLWGRVSDAYGNHTLMRVTGALIPVFPVLWLVAPAFGFLLALQIMGGACWAGFSLACGNYIYDSVSREKRTTYAAIHQVVSSTAIFGGALLGGFVSTVIPESFEISGLRFSWASSLWALMMLSTAGRVIVMAVFLPRLREVRPVRPIGAGELAFRLVRLNALGGLLSELVAQRRTRV